MFWDILNIILIIVESIIAMCFFYWMGKQSGRNEAYIERLKIQEELKNANS